MDVKLTLKLNQDSIQRAKNYGATHGISLSKMVENFFDSISTNNLPPINNQEYSPLVQELAGIINLPEEDDYKLEYENYLRAKYE